MKYPTVLMDTLTFSTVNGNALIIGKSNFKKKMNTLVSPDPLESPRLLGRIVNCFFFGFASVFAFKIESSLCSIN